MKRVYLVFNGLGEEDDTEKVQPESKISLTLAELSELIDKKIKESKSEEKQAPDLLAGIEKILNARSRSDDGRTLDFAPVRQEDIDPEDFLDVPDVFFAHCVYTTVWDDRKYGRSIRPPYGPIYFRRATRTVNTTSNKIPQYTSISVAYIYSKAQSEFIRKHSLFNVKYFEKLGGQSVITKDEADALLRANNMVSGMSEHQVRQRCVASGMTINTSDPDELKQNLIRKLAQDIRDSDALQKANRLEEINSTLTLDSTAESNAKMRVDKILT